MSRAILLAYSLLGPPTLADESASVSLRWQGPSECVGRDQALERLRELMPTLPEQVPEARGALAVEVELSVAEGARALVRFRGERGIDERTLEGASCESVASAAVLVIAVTIDPVGVADVLWDDGEWSGGPEQAQPEPVEPDEPSEAPPDPLTQPLDLDAQPEAPRPDAPEPGDVNLGIGEGPRVRDSSGRMVRGSVGLLGGGGWGPIQAGMGALAVELAVHGPWWRAALRGTWIPARALSIEPSGAGRFDAWLLGGRGCVVPPVARGRVELPACVGVEAGVLRGQGVEPTPEPRSANQTWAALELGPGLRFVPNRWVALGVEVDLVAALLRGGFTIGEQVVQEHASVGVRALAGIELRFP